VKSRARTITTLLTVLCTPGTVATLTDCQLQSCQPSSYWYDDVYVPHAGSTSFEPLPAGAAVVDATHWESGPLEGQWLDYPGQRHILLLPDNFPGPYTNITVYVSPNQLANDNGSSWTQASGNIAEVYSYLYFGQWLVSVTNASCAQYYARVVVERADPNYGASIPDDAGVDAGTDAEAGTPTDASLDAGAPEDASLDAQVDGSSDATSD
jgi:hypothetical protein